MKIIDGLYTLPIEVEYNGRTLPLSPVLVELEDGIALVDTGTPQTTDQLEEAVIQAGHRLEEVRLLIFTHQDGDHAGGGSFVYDRSRPTVCTSAVEALPISGQTRPRGPESNSYPPVHVDIECTGGTVFRTAAGPMEVVETPGHTPGHISLFLRDSGILIAGDALVVHKGSLAGPHPQMSEDVEMARRAVANLAGYPVRGVLCFHGGFEETSPAALQQLSEELLEQSQQQEEEQEGEDQA